MKRLTPAKRNQLVLITVATIALVSMVYVFLISPQSERTGKLKAEATAAKAKLDQIKKAVSQAETNAFLAKTITAQLTIAESDMATGDLFSWTYDTFRQFKSGYKIEIPNIGQPIPSEVDLIPNFPYRQIKFSILGTGYYHDIGKFVADLENKFPHLRVANLMLEPSIGPNAAPEKLSFQMEIMALIKPNL